MSKMKIGFATLAVASAGLFVYAGMMGADCPPSGTNAGQGKNNVNLWAAENCAGDDDCDTDDCFATTCNNEFSIELLGDSENNGFVVYEYEVCRLENSPAGLSHFTIGLGQLDCLGEGFSIANLLQTCTLNGNPIPCTLVNDPTTQVLGVKIDVPSGTETGVGTCIDFTFSLDSSVLAPGQVLDTGCVVAATKAGNQDIRNTRSPSPGYACACGPVCGFLPPQEGCDYETAYAYDEEGLCFIGQHNFNRWGWTILLEGEGEYTFDMYAAAGQCDLDNGTKVGTVTLTYGNGTVEVEFDICPENELVESHVYAGKAMFPVGNNNRPTVAPGQYTIGTDLEGEIWVIVHAVVLVCNECEDEPGLNSCVGRCGEFDDAMPCQCDEACCIFNDCCDDKVDVCGGCVPLSYSCADHCGSEDPTTGGCWCDEECCDFGDCCPDKFAQCGGCVP